MFFSFGGGLRLAVGGNKLATDGFNSPQSPVFVVSSAPHNRRMGFCLKVSLTRRAGVCFIQSVIMTEGVIFWDLIPFLE